MSLRATMHPSQHSFPVEYGETLLEAALRSGVALEYSCNNGRCGKCKARLLQGEIGEEIQSDFVFSQLEKSQNHILLCRCKPASDIEIEVHEIDNAAQIQKQEISTKVYKIEKINPELVILQLRTPRNQTLQFLAGQHITLHIDGLKPRNKSIASCPCNGMYLHFHIRNKNQDEFSNYIFDHLKTKDSVLVTGPYGEFQFDEGSERPAIFIAFESGFAPIKSLIEHTIAREKKQPLYLYWIVTHNQNHYFENYCKAWLDAEDNFHYLPLTLPEGTTDIAQSIKDIMPSIASHYRNSSDSTIQESDFYLNGPAGIFRTALEYLEKQDVPESQIHIDAMKRY
ncbi:MAG: 2Fe-2S iron-sulfur cluster-binding protein [Gammaproteobacteria bacterium]|nr:2Fe-2S iron-sulfur cluster-binding protein [Gammaproteobacteria bacterium]